MNEITKELTTKPFSQMRKLFRAGAPANPTTGAPMRPGQHDSILNRAMADAASGAAGSAGIAVNTGTAFAQPSAGASAATAAAIAEGSASDEDRIAALEDKMASVDELSAKMDKVISAMGIDDDAKAEGDETEPVAAAAAAAEAEPAASATNQTPAEPVKAAAVPQAQAPATAASAPTAAPAPAAATLGQLKAALPEAGAEFREFAIEQGMTVETAKATFAYQRAQTAQASGAAAAAATLGSNRPIAGARGSAAGQAGDPESAFEARVGQAAAKLMKADPLLTQAAAVQKSTAEVALSDPAALMETFKHRDLSLARQRAGFNPDGTPIAAG
ncbi:MAG: hypothetical protein AAGF47_03725 [Planctomycetota bacterium]